MIYILRMLYFCYQMNVKFCECYMYHAISEFLVYIIWLVTFSGYTYSYFELDLFTFSQDFTAFHVNY